MSGIRQTQIMEKQIDSATSAQIGLTYPHHEIHAGNHFFYSDSVTLASAASQQYLITTPNTTKWAHMLIYVDGTAITSWTLYEGADRTGTTVQTVVNSNRNSATTAGVTIHKGTSGGATDGTRIDGYSGGTATNQSRSAIVPRADAEIVGKQNTKYLLTVTSGTNGNLTNVKFAWYEHISG